MNRSSLPPRTRLGRKKGLAGIGAAALIAGTSLGGLSPALAASETFNPFDINNGFTVVSQGDAVLSNGEIEGSIAAFGTISTTNQNGYPVVHNAAGEADYTVTTSATAHVRRTHGH